MTRKAQSSWGWQVLVCKPVADSVVALVGGKALHQIKQVWLGILNAQGFEGKLYDVVVGSDPCVFFVGLVRQGSCE